jgi:hypothetical protein
MSDAEIHAHLHTLAVAIKKQLGDVRVVATSVTRAETMENWIKVGIVGITRLPYIRGDVSVVYTSTKDAVDAPTALSDCRDALLAVVNEWVEGFADNSLSIVVFAVWRSETILTTFLTMAPPGAIAWPLQLDN